MDNLDKEYLIKTILQDQFNLKNLYPYQELVIHSVLERGGFFGKERIATTKEEQLVILPTGSGKSICFMLPALLLKNLTIVVYPLLALMNDQKRRFESLNKEVVLLKGGQSKKEREALFRKLKQREANFVITNAETLSQNSILSQLKQYSIDLFVVDEAHTVTQWGEVFRPSYLKLKTIKEYLKPKQTLAFTATASKEIIDRIKILLFSDADLKIVYGNPDRPNIYYRTLFSLAKKHELTLICANKKFRPLLIFCSSRIRCEQIAVELSKRLQETAIKFYHAGLPKERRLEIESWFYSNKDSILVSTSAYGLGVDKKDIRCVVHYDLSNDIASFLQESGRCGRDGKQAFSFVLLSYEEQIKESELIKAFSDTKRCRRESLLELLEYKSESCDGCGVCDKIDSDFRDGEYQITHLIKHYPLRYTITKAANLLCGLEGESSADKYNPWFGILRSWNKEDVISSCHSLVKSKRVALSPVIGFKGTLYLKSVH
jgi:ATP-dependent DNA helicase RecQ